ncbi:MAG: 5-methylcytosine-specific restriction endonuclease system specificity protein McrC [Defluviitaleaceae bacterium]|nr:5-methylcytosine-specific restriction endonuclease system specificity protein McrC [Defluviitaleaceae bacterium]
MIKIQNIYYMLAYTFQVLRKDSYKKIAVEDFKYVEDLLAAILAKGISSQIKRGLGREYTPCTESLSTPHGKINISESLKTGMIHKKQLVCEFDEFSENIYSNQIIKTTAMLLIRSHEVKLEHKKALKKVMLYFHTIDTLHPSSIQWTGIKYHSHSATYKMLINICYLVMNALLPTIQAGSKKISQFKDEHLHRLFEKFVLAYYRKHYPAYNASASRIDWIVDDGVIDLLPTMQTDITLKYNEKILIIDTKYYGSTLQTHKLYNRHSIHSGNLYQIFAYVKNKDINRSGNVSGVLLYAKTDETLTPNNHYVMSGNKISVKTLDLDKSFEGIESQLNNLIHEWLA